MFNSAYNIIMMLNDDIKNYVWTGIGLVTGASITILYDILQTKLEPYFHDNTSQKIFAGAISIAIGLGVLWVANSLKKNKTNTS